MSAEFPAPLPQRSHSVDPGETFSGAQPQVMDILLLDMKVLKDDPISFLSGTGLHLIPQARDSLLT